MENQFIKKLLPYLKGRNKIYLSLFLLPIILTLVIFFTENDEQFAQLGIANYAAKSNFIRSNCAYGSRPGEAGATYGESSPDGIKYNVRTPANYDPAIAHPLLMVYAPAGLNRARTEKFTGLTYVATAAGFIVAYPDHPELSPNSAVKLGKIPEQIAQKWCVDQKRIYLTGHSDGGTVSMALAFMAGTKHISSAIAPSAAGINYSDLSDRKCPDPISVMVMHSSKDGLFRGFGEQSSGWWAACNDCSPIPEKLDNGCIAYPGCAFETKTWYCEGDESHSKWPAINSTIIDFFSTEKPKPGKTSATTTNASTKSLKKPEK